MGINTHPLEELRNHYKMLKLAICLVILTYASGEFIFRPPEFRPFEPFIEYFVGPYRLCTYKPVDYNKCVHTVEVARRNAIPLQLECVQNDDRESCIRSVSTGSADMTVLNAHGYRGARKEALTPVIFAREDESSLTIAVVPRNITVVDLQEAPM